MKILDDIKRRWGDKSEDITWLVRKLEEISIGLRTLQSILHNSGCPTNKCEGCKMDAEEAKLLAGDMYKHIHEEKEND